MNWNELKWIEMNWNELKLIDIELHTANFQLIHKLPKYPKYK